MDRYQVGYSALSMNADEISISPTSSKAARNVNFPPDTDGIPPSVVVDSGRRESKFFQRPRSLSVWSTSSIISRTSNRFDER